MAKITTIILFFLILGIVIQFVIYYFVIKQRENPCLIIHNLLDSIGLKYHTTDTSELVNKICEHFEEEPVKINIPDAPMSKASSYQLFGFTSLAF